MSLGGVMKALRQLSARLAWAFVNWWLRRAGRVAVPVAALQEVAPVVNRMQEHIAKSGHLARVYHVRWALDMRLADLRAALGRLK